MPSTGSGDEICFDAAGYVHATKADGSTALDTVVHFGASATLNTGGYSYTYFENAEIAYNKTEGLWKGVQKLAWPRQLASYTMDFQCYAP